ncbi:MAG: hypothetical protein D6759_14415 [Chloroflexi bacterium]|nr:MAG: hypothetical protein D6759_14415 [Chloroflexota bacterium]
MPLDLSTLLSSVGLLNSLVEETIPLVQTIRSGFRANNEEAKQHLSERLKQLQQNLQQAGQLARVAEAYLRTYEDVLELVWLCRRAERFLKGNLDNCRNRDNPDYLGCWNVLDAMFETIDSNRDTPRKAVMDRARWYDEEDKKQIEILFQQFTQAYERASVCVRTKVADDLLHELRGMTRSLQDAEALLQSTLYDKILRALQALGS